jgi:hypothetical protein
VDRTSEVSSPEEEGTRSQDSKLLKRYFNIKPVKPRIMNTWDVSVVSKFLPVFTLYPLPELSLKHVQLTYKLTALIALTTAARAHTISALDINYMSTVFL